MTQTRFTVLDETQRHPDLAEQIDRILHRVAPTVTEITDLPLTQEVRFRLLTPKAWRDETRKSQHRTLSRDIADLELTSQEIDAVRTGLRIMGFVPVLVWPLVLGSTLTADDGRSETIVAPQALHHGGLLVNEPALHQVVAHELVHQAQADAHGGAVWTTFFPQKRGITAGGASAVLEGHADWADHQVTARLFGTPADHRQSPKSWRHRTHNALPGIRRLGPSRAAYEQGARLIGRAVAAGGTDLVNRIWKDAAFLPTEEEIADPDAWVRRIERGYLGA
ncbi:zinc-dependent metalloprotease [Streptomyces sp. NPDC005483]|uniref:zinc-dependent metalloprotease n=1 Tax=Streptomyces sp. NPDC005483 TaxID=3154882 RepID=UPI0033AA3001